jgi:MFS transporter, DHA1 family, multidrug resistance protein
MGVIILSTSLLALISFFGLAQKPQINRANNNVATKVSLSDETDRSTV